MHRVYQKWVEFKLTHDYFDPSTTGFRFKPLAETAAALKRLGALFRQTRDGFVVLYPAIRQEDDSVDPLYSFPTDLEIHVGVAGLTPYAGMVSDLPLFSAKRELIYRDNIADRPAAVDGDDIVEVRPKAWTHVEATNDTRSFRLQNSRGEVITASTVAPVEGRLRHTVDLTEHPSGKYTLFADNAELVTFFAVKPQERPNFAVVSLFAGGSDIPDDNAFVNASGEPDLKEFSAEIGAREFTWRYFIVPKFNSFNPAHLNIEDGDSRYTFGSATETQTRAGEMAYLIESDSRIELRREVIKGISLKKNGGMVLVEDLRTPGFEEITVNNDKFFAEMHVYV